MCGGGVSLQMVAREGGVYRLRARTRLREAGDGEGEEEEETTNEDVYVSTFISAVSATSHVPYLGHLVVLFVCVFCNSFLSLLLLSLSYILNSVL